MKYFNSKQIIIGIMLGVIFTLFGNILAPFLLPVISSILFYAIFKNEPGIRKIILVALWMRIFFSMAHHIYLSSISLPRGAYFTNFFFAPDGELYSGHGWWISLLATGKDVIKNNFIGKGGFFYDSYVYDDYVSKGMYLPMNSYQIGFFTYFIATIYSAFGYCPLLINFINCLLGVLIGYISYLITLKIFNKKTAYIALIITLFLPSLFIWSSFTKTKDVLFIFLSVFFLLNCIKFVNEKKFSQLLLALFTILLIKFIRDKSILVFMPIFLVSLFFAFSKYLKKNWMFLIIPILFVAKISKFTDKIFKLIKDGIDTLISLHHGSVMTGGVIYKLRNDTAYSPIYAYNPADMKLINYIIYFSKAIFHFLFEPFPTHLVSVSLFLFFFQQIFWNFLILFALWGIVVSIKNKNPQSYIVLFYILIMGISIALAEANIGTLVRHRDAVTPAIIIFSSVGIARLFKNESNSYISSSFKR